MLVLVVVVEEEEEDEESRRRCLINGPSTVGDTSGRGPIVSDSIDADRFSMMYVTNLLGFQVYNDATCVN